MSRGPTSTGSATDAKAPPTLGQRVTARVLITGVWLLQRLPEGLVYRAAFGAGVVLSTVLRSRRRLLRRNLERVVRWLDANDMANARTRRAAHDARALDAMVRAAFGHWVLTYAETARASRYSVQQLRERVRLETPEVVHAALAAVPPGQPGPMYVSAHFGSVELAGLYAARVGHVPVGGPMEIVANPVMAEYFERTRRALGIDVFPVKGAATAIRERIAAGLAVGLVADRNISGSGTRVQLFGAPARLPAGPAMLAVESGARVCFVTVRRDDRPGRWLGRIDEVTAPVEGTRRERTEAVLSDHARWMEQTVARAPEQWWTLLFPVWEDIT